MSDENPIKTKCLALRFPDKDRIELVLTGDDTRVYVLGDYQLALIARQAVDHITKP